MEKLKAVAEVAHEETFGVSTKVATSQAEQPKPRITMPTRLPIACRSPESDRRPRLILWLIAGQDNSCWLRSSSRFDLSR